MEVYFVSQQHSAITPRKETRSTPAIAGLSAPSFDDAATISGEGVSPAASAAAIGSPPGSAAATCNADEGRSSGSFRRQRSITFSIDGSRPLTISEGVVGVVSLRRNLTNSPRVGASNALRPVRSEEHTSE